MPFDNVLSRNRPASLADCLTEIGVTPVPMSDLEAHKAEQVRLHPANVLGTSKPYLAIGAIFALGMAATIWTSNGQVDGFTVPIILMLGFSASAISFAFISAFCELLDIRLRGKAEWFETDIYFYDRLTEVPPAIREVAEHVRRYAPHAGLRCGQLIQRAVVLDPYIVVVSMGERACLGIWEDDRVVAVAQVSDISV